VGRPAEPGGAGRAGQEAVRAGPPPRHSITATRFEEQAAEAEQAARLVRELLVNRDLEVPLDYLRRSRGFDFTGYKRTSLRRRVDKRIHDVGADGYLSYLDLLEVDPEGRRWPRPARPATGPSRRRESPRSCWSGTSSANGDVYVFSKELRRSVIFGRHDLIQDAPSPGSPSSTPISACWCGP
jgi:hypothetical protein